MKKKLLVLILSAITTALVLTSCKKEGFTNSTKDYLKVEFSVGEQQSVNRYEVETSTDGANFSISAVILASINLEDSYSVKVDVTKLFKDHPLVFTRIKEVDIDGKFLYSFISVTSNVD